MAATMPPATSFVMPARSPVIAGVTNTAMPTVGTVTYAAAPMVTYAAAPPASYAVPAGSNITYAAAPAAGGVAYAAAPTISYASTPMAPYVVAPTTTFASPMTYAAPQALQASSESFTISSEQFQRILAGQPLTQQEIAAASAAHTTTQVQVASSTTVPAAAAVVPALTTGRSVSFAADVMSKESSEGFIQFLSESPFTVQSERVLDKSSGKEAFATLPMELTGKVPEDYRLGDQIVMPSPHGDIAVDVPASIQVQPGKQVVYRLAPSAELRIQVPPGRVAGELVQFRRADGLEIEVPIPKGLKEGDYFDADPPAVMVRVPDNTGPGEAVVFQALRRDGEEVTDLCRALVPQGVAPGKFFVARLPTPIQPDTDEADETSASEAASSPKKSPKKASKKKLPTKKKEKGCC